MIVMVTGSTGLIGSALVRLLKQEGHEVVRLVRSRHNTGDPEVLWDPGAGTIDRFGCEGMDAVVHLAGESIAEGRWTAEKKARIRDSRVNGTTLLSNALAELDQPPAVLASASAIGYYGDRGGELLTEMSPPGTGFLADVCEAWETATKPAVYRGLRVINLRFGMVLSKEGGALTRMLPAFRAGVGGNIGKGDQYMSWVALKDAVGAIAFTLRRDDIRGPLNVVAPGAVTNDTFSSTLGKVLNRPTIFKLPAFMARGLLGEMAESLLLSSARVKPTGLLAAGYPFYYSDLEQALRGILA